MARIARLTTRYLTVARSPRLIGKGRGHRRRRSLAIPFLIKRVDDVMSKITLLPPTSSVRDEADTAFTTPVIDLVPALGGRSVCALATQLPIAAARMKTAERVMPTWTDPITAASLCCVPLFHPRSV